MRIDLLTTGYATDKKGSFCESIHALRNWRTCTAAQGSHQRFSSPLAILTGRSKMRGVIKWHKRPCSGISE